MSSMNTKGKKETMPTEEQELLNVVDKVTEVAKEHGFTPVYSREEVRLQYLENRLHRLDKALEKAQYVLYGVLMGLLIAEVLAL